MTKTILLTGATDGIGLETAKLLTAKGHTLLIHGRSAQKLSDTEALLKQIDGAGVVESYRADLSRMNDVEALASDVTDKHPTIDVIINNAGIFSTGKPLTEEGLDVRFIVNTVAPYRLTQKLLPNLADDGRVVNLSSAAQSPVNLKALHGDVALNDNQAYAQSKLAITMWTAHMAKALSDTQQVIVAVNPGSLLASKMVKEAYGVAGSDLGIGAEILTRAALSDEFRNASGQYFDNDQRRFSQPHADATDASKNQAVVGAIDELLVTLNVT